MPSGLASVILRCSSIVVRNMPLPFGAAVDPALRRSRYICQHVSTFADKNLARPCPNRPLVVSEAGGVPLRHPKYIPSVDSSPDVDLDSWARLIVDRDFPRPGSLGQGQSMEVAKRPQFVQCKTHTHISHDAGQIYSSLFISVRGSASDSVYMQGRTEHLCPCLTLRDER